MFLRGVVYPNVLTWGEGLGKNVILTWQLMIEFLFMRLGPGVVR